MSDVSPHFAIPLRFRAGRFLTVEQGSRRHREDRVEVLLRTRPGDFDHAEEAGLRHLVGATGPVLPGIVNLAAKTLGIDLDGSDVRDIAARARSVSISVRSQDNQEG